MLHHPTPHELVLFERKPDRILDAVFWALPVAVVLGLPMHILAVVIGITWEGPQGHGLAQLPYVATGLAFLVLIWRRHRSLAYRDKDWAQRGQQLFTVGPEGLGYAKHLEERDPTRLRPLPEVLEEEKGLAAGEAARPQGWVQIPWSELRWVALSRWGLTPEGWPSDRPAEARLFEVDGARWVHQHHLKNQRREGSQFTYWGHPLTELPYKRQLHLVRRSGLPIQISLGAFGGAEVAVLEALSSHRPVLLGPSPLEAWGQARRLGPPWPEGEPEPPFPPMSLAEARAPLAKPPR